MELVPEEYERGKRESERDIANGAAKLYAGTRGAWGEYMTQLMAERFAVTVEHTDCFIWAELESYRDGYNTATQTHIDATYGAGAYQRLMDEVDRFRVQQYEESLRRRGLGGGKSDASQRHT